MKFSCFFSLLVLLSVYPQVECGFFSRTYDAIIKKTILEPDKTSLVLGIDENSGFCVIANFTVLITQKDPNFQKYLFLCPAENEEERRINEERSKTKNTLFIRETYGDLNLEGKLKKRMKLQQDQSDMDIDDLKKLEYLEYDCEKPIEPSVKRVAAGKNGISVYLVGFEVFIKKEYQKLWMLDYSRIARVEKPDFQWFNVLTIRFDHKKLKVLSVGAEVYNDLSTFLSPRYQVTNYSLDPKINTLGNQMFYGAVNVKEFYSKSSQNFYFQLLLENGWNEYFNVEEDRYLVENHLIPLHSFVTPLLEKAAHSYGNIALMWKIIKENAWERVETQIKYLTQGVYGIHVISGTYGTLELNGTKIHLRLNGTFEVSLAFWKLVQYTRKDKQFYNILIVTSNNPYEDVGINLCPVSQCKQFGWEYIEEHNYQQGRTICCEVTTENLTLLNLEDFIKVDRILNLKEVPHLENEKLTMNLTKFIEDRKKEPNVNPFIRADHIEYRNQPDIKLLREIRNDKNKVEDFSVTKFAEWIIQDHVLPYIKSVLTQPGQSSGLDQTEKPLLSEHDMQIKELNAWNGHGFIPRN